MISNLIFDKVSTRARYEEAPLLQERSRYLTYLLDRGTSRDRVRKISHMLLGAIRFLDLREARGVTEPSLVDAQTRWRESLNAYRRESVSDNTFDDFRRSASNWLRFCGLLIEEPAAALPYGDVLPNFLSHLRNVRGMAEASVRNARFGVARFLIWAACRRDTFPEITLHDIEQYFESRKRHGDTLRTIATIGNTLRAFFRYAEAKGITENRIAIAIQAPSLPRYEPSPKGPSWQDVRKMIRSCSGDSRASLRARAMLLLLAVYGLRSSELSGLRLNDIDWYDESFIVRRAKNGETQRFPLQFEVGDAILKYLRRGRPGCSCRNVFVTLGQPYRALSAGSVMSIVKRRIRALGIEAPQTGPRGLRHACATQLLHKGYSLSEIADFLGHRTMTSVSIYATPSAQSIRKVAAFSLGGLS